MAGLLDKRREDKDEAEIPTASMADIAFLLLIFFLVTTTINVDTGINMTLPPKLEEEQEPPPVKERNMLKIRVNAEGQVLLEGEIAPIPKIRDEVKKHVLNNGKDPNYAESPDDAVVSIKTARQTPYDTYIDVLDEAWMAYFELWDAEARELGYENYKAFKNDPANETAPGEKNAIREKIPAAVSIAEPDPGSGNGSS